MTCKICRTKKGKKKKEKKLFFFLMNRKTFDMHYFNSQEPNDFSVNALKLVLKQLAHCFPLNFSFS